jgi:hypothetical protein
MAADPNKILVTMSPETIGLLDELAQDDAERLDRNKDRSATVRDLVRSEFIRRKRIPKKSRQNA